MNDDNPSGGPGTDVAVISPELAAMFARMATLIPDETGGGTERILEQVLKATSLDALDDPWESSNAEGLAGKRLLIRSCLRRPSDYKEGLGIFLVVDSLDAETGEQIVWTTSAYAIVAQLVRAYALQQLPAYAEIVIAKRPSERGFRPHHLKFTGRPLHPTSPPPEETS